MGVGKGMLLHRFGCNFMTTDDIAFRLRKVNMSQVTLSLCLMLRSSFQKRCDGLWIVHENVDLIVGNWNV